MESRSLFSQLKHTAAVVFALAFLGTAPVAHGVAMFDASSTITVDVSADQAIDLLAFSEVIDSHCAPFCIDSSPGATADGTASAFDNVDTSEPWATTANGEATDPNSFATADREAGGESFAALVLTNTSELFDANVVVTFTVDLMATTDTDFDSEGAYAEAWADIFLFDIFGLVTAVYPVDQSNPDNPELDFFEDDGVFASVEAGSFS